MNLRCKRALDLCGSALGLALLAPCFGVIAVWVFLAMGRPVLFLQFRAGKSGEPFRLWKFRTMTDKRDPDGKLLPDTARLTRTGRWLRKLSLDELPQLVNVFRGEMSLVGPRPLPLRYLPRYSPQQRRRHEVRPGMTGWAQIHGRSAADWETRLAADVWYVDHFSFLLDLRILVATVSQIWRAEGAPPAEGQGAGEFWGAEGPPRGTALSYPVEQDERELS